MKVCPNNAYRCERVDTGESGRLRQAERRVVPKGTNHRWRKCTEARDPHRMTGDQWVARVTGASSGAIWARDRARTPRAGSNLAVGACRTRNLGCSATMLAGSSQSVE